MKLPHHKKVETKICDLANNTYLYKNEITYTICIKYYDNFLHLKMFLWVTLLRDARWVFVMILTNYCNMPLFSHQLSLNKSFVNNKLIAFSSRKNSYSNCKLDSSYLLTSHIEEELVFIYEGYKKNKILFIICVFLFSY